jgi:hypothetical protein
MKNLAILTLAFIFACSFSFAQFPGENFKQVTGKVKTITAGEPSKGTQTQLVVVDDKSVEMTLVVDPEATFYDAEFYPITLDKIKVNDRVNIRYDKNKEGVNVATWFNILKK